MKSQSYGGKLITTFVLHAVNSLNRDDPKEEKCCTFPPGDGAFIFYARQQNEAENLITQLERLQNAFQEQQRSSAIERIQLQPNNIERETLCYYENSKPGKFEEGDNALFSCDHMLLEKKETNSGTDEYTELYEEGFSWDFFLESPLLVFDDRYNGAGFWKFVEELIRRRTQSFSGNCGFKVQLQGLAVPVAEESIDSGYTYDVFYSEANRSSSDGEHEVRNATKYTVRNIESLKDVLTKSEAYTASVERDVGRSHLVLHIRFSSENSDRQNICIVRLRELELPSESHNGVLSAEVLRLLVEELALASAEGDEGKDTLIFQERGIKEAFDCTRLTHIISKVIRKTYASCQANHVPLFHWLVNLPSGTLHEFSYCGETIVCMKMEPTNALSNAVNVGVRLQDVNITRSTITEAVEVYKSADKHEGLCANEDDYTDDCADDSSLSRRRRKLKVKRLYEMVNNSSQPRERGDEGQSVQVEGEESKTEIDEEASQAEMDEEESQGEVDEKLTPRDKEHDSVARTASTAGSYAESWNTVDLGGSTARRRYRLKRKPKRKCQTPVFSDAPEDESGQIALIEGDFDSTSLRGSSAARSASVASNSARGLH